MSIIIKSDKSLDDWLPALADPTRRRIVEMLGRSPRTASEIHHEFAIAAPAVSRHLRVLRQAGLVAERRVEHDGRVRVYSLQPGPIGELSRWLQELSDAWQAQLDSFQDYVTVRMQRPNAR